MQKKKAISLIVLVITIIVMIILAGAIILTLNNAGIIGKANEAVEKTNLAQVQDMATLLWADAYLDGEANIEQAVISGLQQEGIDTSDYVITVTNSGVNVSVMPEAWKVNVTTIVDSVPIPKGFVASPYEGENTKNGGLVIYELKSNEIAIPSTETHHTSLTTRNQYVWVPVEDFTSFVRQDYLNTTSRVVDAEGNYYALGTSSKYWEVMIDVNNMPLSTQDSAYVTNTTGTGGITNTLAEVQAMYASVKEYKGFYIARYEAGLDTHRTSNTTLTTGSNVYSMMNKKPYNYIPWTANEVMNEDTNGAVQVARSIYPVTNTNYGVVSTLTYGVQWDTTLQWWEDTKAVASLTNSTSYGNYYDTAIASKSELNEGANYSDDYSVSYSTTIPEDFAKDNETAYLLTTGALKAAKVNNIYDMAGNLYEWTMEGVSSSDRLSRGGFFVNVGASDGSPVAVRSDYYPDYADNDVGFRPSLYIKK